MADVTSDAANALPSTDRVDAPAEFFVAGVGASAGGLEPLLEVVRDLGLDSMALVVVQHLAPDHESALTEIVRRAAPAGVDVRTAVDGEQLAPKTVYVIPPNSDLSVRGGVLHVTTGSRSAMPIDAFFKSLAEDLGPASVGIVLSGTGSDGAHGLRAIQDAGGITVVQEPSSAKHEGMPQRALATLTPDLCLPPAEIAAEVTRICRSGARPALGLESPGGEQGMRALLTLVRNVVGHDLDPYRLGTIERRVERRMLLHRLSSLEDYVAYVKSHRAEIDELFRDVMISVTSFFRDPHVWEALETRVIGRLVDEKVARREPVRAWVAGCASGEEAYSVAILLQEAVEQRHSSIPIQVFATDVSPGVLSRARRGNFGLAIERDVSASRLSRFFLRAEGAYQVSRQIRDLVVFSEHDLLRDPPFSRIDIATCRNVLIYLKAPAQKRVLRTLYYALQPAGVLVLGNSETVGDAPELFSVLERSAKLYTKKPGRQIDHIELGPARAPQYAPPTLRPSPATELERMADRRVLELYGPPGVVVNENLEIVQFRGHTGAFFELAPGAPTFELMRLARPALRPHLKRALEQVRTSQRRVVVDVAVFSGDEAGIDLPGVPGGDIGIGADPTGVDEHGRVALRLDVMPLRDPTTSAVCTLVLLMRAPRDAAAPARPTVGTGGAPTLEPVVIGPAEVQGRIAALTARAQLLEGELEAQRHYAHSVLEEMEIAKEQLKASNEELQSSNEELQSTNEELETQREEMQSSNEELTTINEELHNRMIELGQVNDDLHNVLAGIDNAVLIVGMDMCVRRYTPAAETLFRLVPGDIGRPIAFLNPFMGARDVAASVHTVIETLATLEEEVLATNQRWYALKIAPYRTLDHAIRGAIIVLSDIDVKKRAADLTRDVGAFAARALAAVGHPLLAVDEDLRVVWANAKFYEAFELAPEETVGSLAHTLAGRLWRDPAATDLRQQLERALSTQDAFRDLEMSARDGGATHVVAGSILPLATQSMLMLVAIEPKAEVPDAHP